MKVFERTDLKVRRDQSKAGMTLIEMLVAVGIGSIVFAAVAMLTLFTARSFVAMGNYNDLDRYSRNALDVMSREIRQTRSLSSFATNRLQFVDNDGGSLIYNWNPNTGVLSRQKGATTTTLLTDCDYLKFGISQRNPSNLFQFYPATNNITGQLDVSLCKLVDVSWRCSRQILGQKVNTESVQTAKIVLRN